jgi:hypothetical protein
LADYVAGLDRVKCGRFGGGLVAAGLVIFFVVMVNLLSVYCTLVN